MLSKIRKKHHKSYTTIDNKFVNDDSLSLKAKGLFLYLWSKPENWVVRVNDIMLRNSVGQRVVYSAMNELENANYLYRKRLYADGKITGMDYWLSETGDVGNRNLDEQNVDEEKVREDNVKHSNNGEIQSKDLLINKDSTLLINILEKKSLDFDIFWSAYDKKIDKHKCKLKWKRLHDKDVLEILKHVSNYVRSTPDKQFRKNPLTYLNSRTWEDEDIVTANVSDLIAKEIKRREELDGQNSQRRRNSS